MTGGISLTGLQILYKVQVVWPPYKLQDDTWNQRSYTLNVGQYEYPFEFKVFHARYSCSTASC